MLKLYMDNIFFIAGVISVLFLIAKFLEMRFIEKESKPLKFLIRDALIVYFSVIVGKFVLDQINPIVRAPGSKITPIFIDNPEF
jgi:hypothetical protein